MAAGLWHGILKSRINRLVTGSNVAGGVAFTGWNQSIANDLQTQLAAGYQAGEGMGAIANRVADVLGIDPVNPELAGGRAMDIARTEIMGMGNETTMAMMNNSTTYLMKSWYSIGDHRTRETHRIAAATYNAANRIPLQQKFRVGGYLMDHPHDRTAPASEVVNCRCIVIGIVQDTTALSDIVDAVNAPTDD